MDARIKNICKNIQGGKQLEESLPQLCNLLTDNYQTTAKIRLAMHYVTLYETFYDDENTWSRDLISELGKINQFIQDNIMQSQNGDLREKAIHHIDSIRQNIIKRMNILTAYTDIFQNCEYVLNRIEYRFHKEMPYVNEEEFARDVLRYIFDSEDNLVINEKIKEIIGQLPIRITKQKYFEIMNKSLHSYLGAQGVALDTFLYMVKTSAMLYHEDDMQTLYPGLWDKKEYLTHLDYKGISREEYDNAVSMLRAATLMLETESSVCYGFEEIVNECYAILLCTPYSGLSGNAREGADSAATIIVKKINEIFLRLEKKEIPDELMEHFSALEGVQEELSYDTDQLESALYEAEQNHKTMIESMMLDQLFHVLKRAQSLLSNSLFIDFEDQTDTSTVDEIRIGRETAALNEELTQFFNSHDRMIGRAVMANTMNKLPVFFENHKDVMDYVRYSLDRCTDNYEKSACVEIINEIMSE